MSNPVTHTAPSTPFSEGATGKCRGADGGKGVQRMRVSRSGNPSQSTGLAKSCLGLGYKTKHAEKLLLIPINQLDGIAVLKQPKRGTDPENLPNRAGVSNACNYFGNPVTQFSRPSFHFREMQWFYA